MNLLPLFALHRILNSGSRIRGILKVNICRDDKKPVTDSRFGGRIDLLAFSSGRCDYRRGGLTFSCPIQTLHSIVEQLLTPLLLSRVRAREDQPTGWTQQRTNQLNPGSAHACNLVPGLGHKTLRDVYRSDLHRRLWGPADRPHRGSHTERPSRKQSLAPMNATNALGILTGAYGSRYITEGGP